MDYGKHNSKEVYIVKTLIVYATKHGSTEKCANMLSEKLTGQVDLINLKGTKTPDLSEYDSVIVGGSVYIGKIRKEVSGFCSESLDELKEKRLGLFICCMAEGETASEQLEKVFPQELSNVAKSKASFGGEFRFNKMNAMERFIIKKVTKSDEKYADVDLSKGLSQIDVDSIEAFARLMNAQ